jgi:hypothetical protein
MENPPAARSNVRFKLAGKQLGGKRTCVFLSGLPAKIPGPALVQASSVKASLVKA